MTSTSQHPRPDPTDDAIRDALRAENDDFLRDLDEPGVLARTITALRQGPRWTTAYVVLASTLFGVAGTYAVYRLLNAVETREMILWSTCVLASLIVVTAIKIWFWMQMEKYVVLREVKRLEFQVARLVERGSRA